MVEDSPAIWQLVSQQDGLFFQPGLVSSQADVESWLEWIVGHARAPGRTNYRFAVELIESAELIGSTRIDVESNHDHFASLGYALAQAHWGRGYATEAATLALGFGFGELGLHRVEAITEPENARSLRVLEKLGMCMEGRLKERLRANDSWRDAILYAITEDEWRRLGR